jgi:hypothetical protein
MLQCAAYSKYGVGLNHFPSGRFAANAAWLVLNVVAHNLGRWAPRIGMLAKAAPMTTKTLRTRILSIPGRATTSGRRRTLHLPRHWPWKGMFNEMLSNLRAIRLPAVCLRA